MKAGVVLCDMIKMGGGGGGGGCLSSDITKKIYSEMKLRN